MDTNNIRILIQYIDALNHAVQRLEAVYVQGNVGELEKTKKFILEVKSKIDEMLK